jgi:thiamine biosynthesis lipoprotein
MDNHQPTAKDLQPPTGGKRILQGSLILAVIVIAALLFQTISQHSLVSSDGGYRQVMGTIAHIVAVAPNTKTADLCVASAFNELVAVDKLMSDYDPDSQLSQVNQKASEQAVTVSDSLFEVLTFAIEYSKKTDGAFDITIGPVIDLWRQAGKDERKPTDNELAAARAKVGFEKLLLNPEKKTVKFTIEGMRLDLGGIAKGYAIDKAVQAMQSKGALGGMVDVGGDIRCFGLRSKDDNTWLIGLQDPRQEDILLKLRLTDNAVATSGDYRRFVIIEGQRLSHIYNPSTSISANELSSASIIAPTAMQADVLATAVSVMGKEKGIQFVESTENVEAILIETKNQKNIVKTPGAVRYIE